MKTKWTALLSGLCGVLLCVLPGDRTFGNPDCPLCENQPRPVQPPAFQHSDWAEIPDMPVPIIKVKVKAPACWETGKEMEYRIRIENHSPADAHHVVIKESLPASLKILRISPMPQKRFPELEWYWETIPGNGCADIVVSVMPMAVANVKSCVRVAYEHGQCVTTKVIGVPRDGPSGPVIGPSIPGTIPPPPDFSGPIGPMPPPGVKPSVSVQVFGPQKIKVNVPESFLFVVKNNNFVDANNVRFGLKFPTHLKVDTKLLGGPPPIGFQDNLNKKDYFIYSLALGTLKPGEDRKITIPFTAIQVLQLDLTASVSADNSAEDRLNFKIDVFFQEGGFGQGPNKGGLHLEMVDSDDPIMVGVGKTTYPIVVVNQGAESMRNVRVSAKISPLLQLINVTGPKEGWKANTREELNQLVIDFEPIVELGPKERAEFRVFVQAREKPGQARLEVQMRSDNLDVERLGPVLEQENTTILSENPLLTSLRRRVRHTK